MTSLTHIKSRINMMPPESQVLAGKLLDEIEFMAKTLKKMKHEIETNGPILEGVGSKGQNTVKANPTIAAYNATAKTYSTYIRQLCDLCDLEKPQAGDPAEEIYRFTAGIQPR